MRGGQDVSSFLSTMPSMGVPAASPSRPQASVEQVVASLHRTVRMCWLERSSPLATPATDLREPVKRLSSLALDDAEAVVQSGALSVLSRVISLQCAAPDVVQEALVAVFLMLQEDSESPSVALQLFLSAGGRAALATAQARSPSLPVETLEWASSIASILPPERDGEVLEQTPEPEPEPQSQPEPTVPEFKTEAETERWSAELKQAREQWSPPRRVELNSAAQERIQTAKAKVAELHSTMEETQQRAATTQSNVAAALAASANFESKWQAFSDRFDGLTSRIIGGLQQHAQAAAERVAVQQEQEGNTVEQQVRSTQAQWRKSLRYSVFIGRPVSAVELRWGMQHDMPLDCWLAVCSEMKPVTLVTCMQLSRSWYKVARNATIWRRKCEELWSTKVYVPQLFRDMTLRSGEDAKDPCADTFEAFRLSIIDSKREWLTEEEICGFTWWSRMKASAGEDWKRRDPWWQGHSARRSRYFVDGRTARIEETENEVVATVVEASHTSVNLSATATTSLSGSSTQAAVETQAAAETTLTEDELHAQQLQLLSANDDGRHQPSQSDACLCDDEQEHRQQESARDAGQPSEEADQKQHVAGGQWRFVEVCCGKRGQPGHFVRTCHAGREVPTKLVGRHANWGWIMDACWSVSTSFPLPRQGEDESLEDDALAMTVQTQREEAMAYNYGMNMPNAVQEDVGADARGLVAPTTDGNEAIDINSSEESAVNPDAMLLARLLGAQ